MLPNKKRIAQLEEELATARHRISELERSIETGRLRDPLTDLPNFAAFERHLDGELKRCKRHRRKLALAVVDVDGFRNVNARHGRAVGDSVLSTVATTLNQFTRASDLVCRASADEFLVMLPEADGDEAMACFERILLELEAASCPPLDCISVSVGICTYDMRLTTGELVAHAGKALDRARSVGGGRAELLVPGKTPSGPDPAHRDAIAGLAEALLERDRYTGEHSESVVALVESVARGLGLDEAEVERISNAALLHDIGKVAIPDSILHKPGGLSDEEWQIMREHPVIGERILRAIPGMGGIARIVRHEHERFDGGGYPDGLVGEAIPIGSRIILACDAYHAMTSDRPYRAAMSHADAIQEIARSAGTQFDPQVTGMLIGSLYGSVQLKTRPSAGATATPPPHPASGPTRLRSVSG